MCVLVFKTYKSLTPYGSNTTVENDRAHSVVEKLEAVNKEMKLLRNNNNNYALILS